MFHVSMSMNPKTRLQRRPPKFNDKSTSDVIIRLTSDEGRNDYFHCHVSILTQNSQYFATVFPNNLNCIEVNCPEPEVNSLVSTLRLLYSPDLDTWHGVSHTLGILLAAHRLGCHVIADACISYLEAAPWAESEEDEILRSVPLLGPRCHPILSRILPVDPAVFSKVFSSAISFATSAQSTPLEEVKHSIQEQLEYLLTEDEDPPIPVNSKVNGLVNGLLTQVDSALTFGQQSGTASMIVDVCWVSGMMSKMGAVREVVGYWAKWAEAVVVAVEGLPNGPSQVGVLVKVVEAVIRVLEAIGSGAAILPQKQRLSVVNAWLPFVGRAKQEVDFCGGDVAKVDFDFWERLETAMVLTLLTLPSGALAEVLTGWLRGGWGEYPDLMEAFEVWCFRSKAVKRRFGLEGGPFSGPT